MRSRKRVPDRSSYALLGTPNSVATETLRLEENGGQVRSRVNDELIPGRAAHRRPQRRRDGTTLASRDQSAAQFVVLASKARALLRGRYHVAYEDIRALAAPILRHRILLNFQVESDRLTQDDILKKLLEAIPAPRE